MKHLEILHKIQPTFFLTGMQETLELKGSGLDYNLNISVNESVVIILAQTCVPDGAPCSSDRALSFSIS